MSRDDRRAVGVGFATWLSVSRDDWRVVVSLSLVAVEADAAPLAAAQRHGW